MAKIWLALIAALLLGAAPACSYTMQRSNNPLLEKEGIRRIYVSPLVNNTYKPGVENLVYNELIRIISAGRRVRLVGRAEDADAILSGSVGSANYAPSATTRANELYPQGQGSRDVDVATVYNASLECSFVLTRSKKAGGDRENVWSSGFSRSKTFPGNNQIGVYGTTSALINESEFDRALKDLAESMMADLHESMLAMF